MRSINFVKQGKTEIVYRWLLECFFPFLKIGVSRALSSLSGKTPLSKEILKICFKITNISSEFFGNIGRYIIICGTGVCFKTRKCIFQ